MTDIVDRLRNPPFGTETSERLLMATAADEIATLRRELAEAAAAHNELVDELRQAHKTYGEMMAEARDKALEDAAQVAYRKCAQTRHVRLGDTAAAAIRAMKGDGK